MGWWANQIYTEPRGKPQMRPMISGGPPRQRSLAHIAHWNEYGLLQKDPAKTIWPARPFMAVTLNNNADRWSQLIVETIAAARFKKPDIDEALEQFAKTVIGDLRYTIENWPSAGTIALSNAPRTIQDKGFDHALTDTGQLADNIRYKIKTPAKPPICKDLAGRQILSVGWRLWRRIQLTKYMSFNVSKSGVSYSAGRKSMRFTLRARGGIRHSVGIPTKGIFWTNVNR